MNEIQEDDTKPNFKARLFSVGKVLLWSVAIIVVGFAILGGLIMVLPSMREPLGMGYIFGVTAVVFWAIVGIFRALVGKRP